jgi:endonuclease/exonuclease/phosphatase family metal-dependent hydrolase
MIARTEAFMRRMFRAVSRSEWMARLLDLPRSEGTATAPGLILVQVDGLSHTQLLRALEGKMPFLRRLVRREHYRLHPLYSGMPSSTPAVQAELFYGVRGAVPAFSFRHARSGRIIRMFEAEPVALIEQELARKGGRALLTGGSAYADVYTGGAAEAHFCPTSLGWGPPLRDGKRWATALLIASHAYSFLRTAALFLLEILLAIVDCVRGIIAKRDLVKELRFVPIRVVISILLRELSVIGAKIDIARGLPIVHLNLLGYDEQAHRRGPNSAFAHWTLKGIDDAIARLWRAAHRSTRRHYDVWIFADHGQESVMPYARRFGRSVEAAVQATFASVGSEYEATASTGDQGVRHHRVRWFGGRRTQRLFRFDDNAPEKPRAPAPLVAALGPVGMVYPLAEVTDDELAAIARDLVVNAKIPMVLTVAGDDGVLARTHGGEFMLPDEAPQVLGPDHPFLEDAARDLVLLCHHPDAGALVLCGWCHGAEPLSFAVENGAHGGAGPEETRGFALLPADAPLDGRRPGHLRPFDLRQAAQAQLGHAAPSPKAAPRRVNRETLRVMTYNVHSCVGMDGKLAPERIARIIAQHAPDVVALQELDVGRKRSNSVDQAAVIAGHLEMGLAFHPAMHVEEERYGDAILTHLPMRLVKAGPLPTPRSRWPVEPRGALWVAVDLHGTEVQILNTHLGLLPHERRAQAEALIGRSWLGHPSCCRPVVLCGDFNALPRSPVCRQLGKKLRDVETGRPRHRLKSTFFGRFPIARIDHIFVDRHIGVDHIEIPNTTLTRLASDHLPLIADLRLGDPP